MPRQAPGPMPMAGLARLPRSGEQDTVTGQEPRAAHRPVDQAHPQAGGASLQLDQEDVAEILGAGAAAAGARRGLRLAGHTVS